MSFAPDFSPFSSDGCPFFYPSPPTSTLQSPPPSPLLLSSPVFYVVPGPVSPSPCQFPCRPVPPPVAPSVPPPDDRHRLETCPSVVAGPAFPWFPRPPVTMLASPPSQLHPPPPPPSLVGNLKIEEVNSFCGGDDDCRDQTKGSPVSRQEALAQVKMAGKLFVGGLSKTTTAKQLKDYFSQFGSIIECFIKMALDPVESRGFGFVTFAHPSKIEEVLAAGPLVLNGNTLDVRLAIPKHMADKVDITLGCRKVFVGGLSKRTDKLTLQTYFSTFGSVQQVLLLTDPETGRHRGFAFITFEDSEIADRVCLQNPHVLGNHIVECKLALPKACVEPSRSASPIISTASPLLDSSSSPLSGSQEPIKVFPPSPPSLIEDSAILSGRPDFDPGLFFAFDSFPPLTTLLQGQSAPPLMQAPPPPPLLPVQASPPLTVTANYTYLSAPAPLYSLSFEMARLRISE